MLHSEVNFRDVEDSMGEMNTDGANTDHPDFLGDIMQLHPINDNRRNDYGFSVENLIHAPGRKMVVEMLDRNFVETGKVLVFYDLSVYVFRPTENEISAIRRAPTWLHEDTLHTNFRWDNEYRMGAQLMTRYTRPSGHALCFIRLPDYGTDRDLRGIPGDLSDNEDEIDEDAVFYYFWHPVLLDVEADRAQDASMAVFPYFPDVPALQPFRVPRLFSHTPTCVRDLFYPPALPDVQSRLDTPVSMQISAKPAWLAEIAAACVVPGPAFLIVYRDMTTLSVDAAAFFGTIVLWGGQSHLFQWKWPVWVFSDVYEHQIVIGDGFVKFYTRYRHLMKSLAIFRECEPLTEDRKRLRNKSLCP